MYACVCDWLGFSYREEVQWVSEPLHLRAHIPGTQYIHIGSPSSLSPTTHFILTTIFQVTPKAACVLMQFSEVVWFLCFCTWIYFLTEFCFKQDVDTIYLTQDTRELNLQDFSHLEHR